MKLVVACHLTWALGVQVIYEGIPSFFLLKIGQKGPKIVKITVFFNKIPYFLCEEYPKSHKMSEIEIKSSLSIP